MKTITHKELVSLLSARKGAHPIGLETLTLAAKKSPFGPIYKKTRGSFCTGAIYQKSVEKAAVESGVELPKFQSGDLPYGHFVVNGKVIEHKGEFQLRTQYRNGKRNTKNVKVAYFDENGSPVDSEAVKALLPKKTNLKQGAAGIKEAKQVHVKNYKFENILKVTLNKETYILSP